MTLTARQVEAAKPQDRPYKLTDGRGLYLYVSTTGAKSWRANYTQNGKQGTRTYGRWPEMSLSDARKAHQAHGTGVMVSEPVSPTFRAVAREWMKKHLPGLSNAKHRIQVESTMEAFVFPQIGDRPIAAIKRADLVAVVSAIADRVETAHRVAGRVTAVFAHAQDAGILESHPAANLTRALPARRIKAHMPSIRPEDARDLLVAIDSYPDAVTRLGLLLAAHTFVRVGELRGWRWDELREDGRIWVIPEARMKMGLPHVVPLSDQVQEMLATLREMSGGTLVLESPAHPGHPLSENTLLFALYRLGYRGRMTVHGFRALASTVMNEAGQDHDVIERQLAHKETDAVRLAYNRADYLEQRRDLMRWWSAWLDAQHVVR